MIRGLWVIDRGGICIFHESFGEEVKHDPLMFSSFISAMFSFSQEIGEKPLELTETEEYRFVYTLRSPLLFVLAGDKQETSDTLKCNLEQIIDDFFNCYEETAWQVFITSLRGTDSVFYKYKDRLMQLLKHPNLKLEKQLEQKESLSEAFSKFVKSSKKEIV